MGPIISHNNERVKIGSSNPDFDPFLIISFISIKGTGDERQGAAGALESMGSDEAGIGSRKKQTARRRGRGALRAAEAEASWALISADMNPGMNRATSPVHVLTTIRPPKR